MPGDCFLKLDGIAGEALDKEFPGEIQISGWTWGLNWTANRALAGAKRQGATDVRALTFTHDLDVASPPILHRCATGAVIPQGVLTMRRAGGTRAQIFLKITLKRVQISAVELTHDDQSGFPVERVTLQFESVDFDYTTQSERGSNRSGATSFSWQLTDR